MSKQMIQAIRVHQYGGPEQLKLEQIPCPEPQAGEVLIRVHAAALSDEPKFRCAVCGWHWCTLHTAHRTPT